MINVSVQVVYRSYVQCHAFSQSLCNKIAACLLCSQLAKDIRKDNHTCFPEDADASERS